MKRVLRPIWGFGPWGWVLVAVAAALVYCAAGGFDLRHAIMQAVADRFGYRAMTDWVIYRLLVGSYLTSLNGTTCGPVTLLPMLIAMFITPRRWAWWQWGLVSLWLLLNPWLCFETATRLPLWFARSLGWSGGPPSRVVFVGELLGLELLAIGLLATLAWRISGRAHGETPRSRWRFAPPVLFVFGALMATTMWWLNRLANTQSVIPPNFVWYGLATMWHLGVAFLTIAPALAARRLARAQPWYCDHCGYDLRGLKDSPACPECGRPAGTMPPCPSPLP